MYELTSPRGTADEMFPLHGPYHPARTNGAAGLIDALARYLNYATRHADALPGPTDAYELTGALRVAASKLPQAFRQLGQRVEDYAEQCPGADEAQRASDALRQAGTLALALAGQLATVQSSLRGLAVEPGLGAEPGQNSSAFRPGRSDGTALAA